MVRRIVGGGGQVEKDEVLLKIPRDIEHELDPKSGSTFFGSAPHARSRSTVSHARRWSAVLTPSVGVGVVSVAEEEQDEVVLPSLESDGKGAIDAPFL